MRRFLHLAIVVACVTSSCLAGEVVDRIVAIVNNTPIFQSDWESALRVEALLDAKDPGAFSTADQKSVLDRLVDQELLREQLRGFPLTPVTDEELRQRVQEIQTQLNIANPTRPWGELLQQVGISETEFESRVRLQMELLRFLDSRFRPLIRVEYRAIQAYYRDQFLPELKKQGGQEIPLSEASPKIREILTQQRMDEQIATWLQTLREQANVRIPGADTKK